MLVESERVHRRGSGNGQPRVRDDPEMVYPDSLKSREKFLAFSELTDSVARMIQSSD